MRIIDNGDEIKNMYVHEAKHYSDYKSLGLVKYLKFRKDHKDVLELRAIYAQIKSPTFQRTRVGFQNGVYKYAENFGGIIIKIKPLPAHLILPDF